MTQKILTTQDRLGQIFTDNKACKNPDCACCVHWSATVYRLLTMLGTVLDTLQTTVDAKSGLLQEMADIKRRLLLCDNSSTPSSQIPISEKKRGDPGMILAMSPRKRSRAPSRDMGKPRKGFRLKPRNTTSVPRVQDATERI